MPWIARRTKCLWKMQWILFRRRFILDNAIKLVEEQIEKGVLNPRMTIEEMIDILENKKIELIGDDEIEDNDDKNE